MFCNTYITSLLFSSEFYINSIRPSRVRNVSLASVILQKIKSKTENTTSSNNDTNEINIDMLHTKSDEIEGVSNQKTSKHCTDINKVNKQDPEKNSKIPHRIIADNGLLGKLINKQKQKYVESILEQTKSTEQSTELSWILKDMKNDKVTDNETDTSNKLGDTESQNTLVDASENLWQSTDNSQRVISCKTQNDVLSFPILHIDKFKNFYIRYKEGHERYVPYVANVLIKTEPFGRKMLLKAFRERMVKTLGQDNYQINCEEASRNGKLFHSCIAKTLWQKQIDVVMPLTVNLAYNSLKPFLNDLQTIEEINIFVTHPNLRYSVKIDCIAWYRDTLCIIDWKKTHKRRESFKMLFDAPLKLAASIGAVNASDSNPYRIDTGYIVSGCSDGRPATVHKVNGDVLQNMWVEWLTRLCIYNANFKMTEN
ncbi:uncharacterized protein LOC143347843 isoform X2 [Colletes latitarsis]|uniref:uncharacterized protein LOC143347843 isoform X2 n=1 Tax=Colletes latitarsis TaxID=2605962 RepID=UPI0040363C41